MIKEQIHSDLAIPPGKYLEEVIVELGMTKNELAQRMNRPPPKLSAIFAGDKAITPDTALQLEKVVGVPAHIWTGLEAEYRLTLARNQEIQEMQRLRNESNLTAKFCYSELVKLGYVSKKIKPVEKVLELHRFFRVTSLRNISAVKRYQAAFRQGKGKRSPEATATWLRIGEVEAQTVESKPFSKRSIEDALPTIRNMTRSSPKRFKIQLQQILLNTGVVLVLCPHLPKTYVNGATFWLKSNKAVLMLTIRGCWADIFWFSLFHEIGHLLFHGKQSVFIESEDNEKEVDKFEREADQFAADILVPPSEYKAFVETNDFYPQAIKDFASHLGVHAGIVVGRLQHDKHIEPAWHNSLRSRYEWKIRRK